MCNSHWLPLLFFYQRFLPKNQHLEIPIDNPWSNWSPQEWKLEARKGPSCTSQVTESLLVLTDNMQIYISQKAGGASLWGTENSSCSCAVKENVRFAKILPIICQRSDAQVSAQFDEHTLSYDKIHIMKCFEINYSSGFWVALESTIQWIFTGTPQCRAGR
jgi:hypothetical protein